MLKVFLAVLLSANFCFAKTSIYDRPEESVVVAEQTLMQQNPYLAVGLTLILAGAVGYVMVEPDRAGGAVAGVLGAGLGIIVGTF